ncbi:TetR/AcrR family transcriptional regulator [Sphingomonas sp. SRS2]|uniref:TetR/AcrR family transcriptional regulator n=1 Tax=Sphingomonas sp. SRS2 TaxID=133190 RepID=UPI0006966356|nr:TetR/AcrR family transcriptional regulator [Sphingomonas sp. SRS2]
MPKSNIMPKSNMPSSNQDLSVRDRLLAVAAVHFAEHGLQGASQRAIQREVGVNPGAANYYFKTKEALYVSVIENALEPILAERLTHLETVPENTDFLERLRYLLRSYLGPMVREADTPAGHSYLRIVAAQFSHADIAKDAMELKVAAVRERYIELLSKMFPAASRNRLYEVLTICVSISATIPTQSRPEDLNKARIAAMVEDMTEISVLIFRRLCDPTHP